jgi:hypothetical protein
MILNPFLLPLLQGTCNHWTPGWEKGGLLYLLLARDAIVAQSILTNKRVQPKDQSREQTTCLESRRKQNSRARNREQRSGRERKKKRNLNSERAE